MIGIAVEYTPDNFYVLPCAMVLVGREDPDDCCSEFLGLRIAFAWLFFGLYFDFTWGDCG